MLSGKVAIVTGGGTGIGRAISQRLAKEGGSVAIVYSRSQQDAVETVQQIETSGGHAISLACDVAKDSDVRSMVEEVVRTCGGVDYVVNNAGITRQQSFADLDSVDDGIWEILMAVNVKGAFNVSRAAAASMRTRPGAAIVNIGSMAGETGVGSSLPYAVSKAAMHGLTRSLARALAPAIRVNCVAPGAVVTRWWKGYEAKMHQLAGQVALQRVASPDDIAQIAVALLAANAMTGQIVRVDNGQTL
jgi:3-oxoacyl-[acyl-carrier protein] reductase